MTKEYQFAMTHIMNKERTQLGHAQRWLGNVVSRLLLTMG